MTLQELIEIRTLEQGFDYCETKTLDRQFAWSKTPEGYQYWQEVHKGNLPAEFRNDRIVTEVIEEFKERSRIGIIKYGTTLEDNNNDNYFKHAKEEVMDLLLYIHKIESVVNANPSDTTLGYLIRKMFK
jgi:uncharacterized HAD superfamily protein